MSDTPTRRRALTRAIEEGKPLTEEQRFCIAMVIRVLGVYRERQVTEGLHEVVLEEMADQYDKLIALEVPRV